MRVIIENNGEDWYHCLSLVWSYLQSSPKPPSYGEIVSDGKRTFFVKKTKTGYSFQFGIFAYEIEEDDSTDTETLKYEGGDA